MKTAATYSVSFGSGEPSGCQQLAESGVILQTATTCTVSPSGDFAENCGLWRATRQRANAETTAGAKRIVFMHFGRAIAEHRFYPTTRLPYVFESSLFCTRDI